MVYETFYKCQHPLQTLRKKKRKSGVGRHLNSSGSHPRACQQNCAFPNLICMCREILIVARGLIQNKVSERMRPQNILGHCQTPPLLCVPQSCGGRWKVWTDRWYIDTLVMLDWSLNLVKTKARCKLVGFCLLHLPKSMTARQQHGSLTWPKL